MGEALTSVNFDVSGVRVRLVAACDGIQAARLDDDTFPTGPGVYLLQHTGTHPLYRRFGARPIYIGRSATLRQRIHTHQRTLHATHDLDPNSFGVVAIATESRAIAGLFEELLIEHFRPVWNQHQLGGFGNRDPGAKRSTQKTSPFDRAHPGRHWARGPAEPCPELTAWVAAYD